jgi:hypothetical protein
MSKPIYQCNHCKKKFFDAQEAIRVAGVGNLWSHITIFSDWYSINLPCRTLEEQKKYDETSERIRKNTLATI